MVAQNDGTIKSQYTRADIEFALRHVADEKKTAGAGAFRFFFNLQKIKKALALMALSAKADGFYLSEFVEAVKHQFELFIPTSLQAPDAEVDPKSNLLEGYAAMDLSFLKGFAIIIPSAHLRAHEKGAVAGTLGLAKERADDLIKLLSPYKSKQFAECHADTDARLEVLFNIKDKWTYKEIEAYIKSFTDQETHQKYDQWLSRNSRLHKEANPFNEKVITQFYIKKF